MAKAIARARDLSKVSGVERFGFADVKVIKVCVRRVISSRDLPRTECGSGLPAADCIGVLGQCVMAWSCREQCQLRPAKGFGRAPSYKSHA